MLIKGSQLNAEQRRLVLNSFHYRWTVENLTQAMRLFGHSPPTVKPITDAEWLEQHAFHFVKDGSRLMTTHRYAEPAYMAD